MGIESVNHYNQRVEQAIRAFRDEGETVAIIGKGRNIRNSRWYWLKRARMLGLDFLIARRSISDFESAKNYIKPSVETRTVQNLINSYITNPRGFGSRCVLDFTFGLRPSTPGYSSGTGSLINTSFVSTFIIDNTPAHPAPVSISQISHDFMGCFKRMGV